MVCNQLAWTLWDAVKTNLKFCQLKYQNFSCLSVLAILRSAWSSMDMNCRNKGLHENSLSWNSNLNRFYVDYGYFALLCMYSCTPYFNSLLDSSHFAHEYVAMRASWKEHPAVYATGSSFQPALINATASLPLFFHSPQVFMWFYVKRNLGKYPSMLSYTVKSAVSHSLLGNIH